ncbi:MAG: DedA family protein [Planctomycetes bacterium]|nr:DedA family protein [Planctomycetota bacterium]MCD7897162.1 DedA family protein [Planctomycetaceae bacterium]
MLDWFRDKGTVILEFLATWTTVFCVWLANTVLTLGYPGIVFLMAVESSLVPFPSELVMPPAGYLIHEGQMSWLPVILAGTAGSLLGALFNYFLALRFGRPFLLRFGKYVFLKPEHLERTERFFASHGEITTFVGRLIPVIRQLISLPAGISRMPLGRFCFFTTFGAALWITILTVIGWLVGQNQDLLHEHMRNATLWVIGGAGLVVILYIKWKCSEVGRKAPPPETGDSVQD